jgi:hypothetical protein
MRVKMYGMIASAAAIDADAACCGALPAMITPKPRTMAAMQVAKTVQDRKKSIMANPRCLANPNCKGRKFCHRLAKGSIVTVFFVATAPQAAV